MRAQAHWLRIAGPGVAVLAATTLAGAALAPNAAADTSPPSDLPPTVTADVLPTPQVDGVVWSTAIAGNTVVAVGRFTKARPAGVAAGGTGEVARSNILAFDVNTGALSSAFAPSLNGQALSVEAAPDGSKVYVGGDFTTVNGVSQARIAALKVGDGSLDTTFRPTVSARVNALSVTGDTVYAGGNFFNANGKTRTRLAAFSRANGTLLPWNPAASDGEVFALVAAGGRVVIGGKFANLAGTARQGIGAVHPTSGAALPWSSRPIPTWQGGNKSWVTDLIVKNGVVYGTANGEGWHWFDGRFAADLATGDLVWLDNCYGASYGLAAQGDVLYTASHAHDCTSIGGFPEMIPKAQRALATTLAATGTDQTEPGANSNYAHQPIPSLLHWFPTLSVGSATGQGQAAWAVASNDRYVIYGGEFPNVNGTAQSGLVRFAVPSAAPKKQGPQYTADLIPSGISTQAGKIRLAWTAVADRDNNELTYELLRDNVTTPIFTVKEKSAFWTLPNMGFIDSGLAPGSAHTYRVRVKDANGNTVTSPRSASVTVTTAELSDYAETVLSDDPAAYWRLGEAGGTTVYDAAGFDDAVASAGVTRGAAGAVTADTDTASAFSGAEDGFTANKKPQTGSDTLAVETWIKTTSTSGGKIAGFGGSNTGLSSSYDRHLYMDDAGRIWFGAYPNEVRTVNSAKAYNDGQWHHVVGTLGANGLVLYVDGKRVGRDPNTTSAQQYSGYWRVGGDNLNGWPNQPSSSFFAGEIDEVAIYDRALTWEQVVAHYSASGRSGAVVPSAPADAYGKTVYQDNPTVYFRLNETGGTNAIDSGPNAIDGGIAGGVTLGASTGVDGAGTAATFNGSDGGVFTASSVNNPTVYSEELWFNTTTTAGGKLIGFGNQPAGGSSNYDRHVYMSPDGSLNFGAWTGEANVARSAQPYNDGQWHHVVATQSGDGMKLYVDGALVATHHQTQAQPYSGYWRVGGDSTWDGAPYFAGTIDEVAVYGTALTQAQVTEHWQTGSNQLPPNGAPTAAFSVAKQDLAVTVDASSSTDADGSIESYEWAFGDGATASGKTPAAHTYASAGTYEVRLTVTDNRGGTATATESVSVLPANGAPTAAFSVAKQDLAVTVDASSSTDADGSIESYEWAFGDGATASGKTPAAHTYASAGTYEVRLTVTDNRGGRDTVTQAVTVTAPLNFVLDAFARTVAGGWGTADTGGDWTRTGAATAFAVTGGRAEISLGAGSGRSAHLRSVSSDSTDLTARISVDKVPAVGATSVSLAGRSITTDGEYRARVRFLANNTLGVALVRTNAAGTETLLKAEAVLTGVTYGADEWINVRLQVTGSGPTTVRAKVWKAGTAEPAGWFATVTDDTAGLQRAGSVGLFAYLSASATNAPVKVLVDDVKATAAN